MGRSSRGRPGLLTGEGGLETGRGDMFLDEALQTFIVDEDLLPLLGQL
jgi:hypothetical protein